MSIIIYFGITVVDLCRANTMEYLIPHIQADNDGSVVQARGS